MTYLLDTDTCVYWLRGHPTVQRRLLAAGPSSVGISILTIAELRFGAELSTQPTANHAAIDAFTAAISVVGIDSPIVAKFGGLKADLQRRGRLLEDFDLAIAATAIVHGLTLVTNNQEHFGRIAGLKLDNWV